MSEPNSYFQQEILNKPLQKHGLLEELNLPPKAIRFIRENKRNLVIGLCCLVAAILGWSYYNHYTDRQNDRAAALLAEAMATGAVDKRQEQLRKVQADFGSTGSSLWAEIELAHIAHDAGNYDEAIAGYRKVLGEISSSSPVFPLVQLNLAQAFEDKKMPDEALSAYEKLAGKKGFSAEAFLAMARMHQEKGDAAGAKEMYKKLLALEEASAALKEMAQARLDRM